MNSDLPSENPMWKVGAQIVDDAEGDQGIIIEILDDHNISVDLIDQSDGRWAGRAMYCNVPGCEEYYPCKLIPPQ